MFNSRRDGRSPGKRLMWLALYLGISLGISLFLPFPISLLVIFTAFLAINSLRARRVMKEMGISGIKELFNRLSVPMGYQKVKYYCMICGYEHREISCPKCGSRIKRVG